MVQLFTGLIASMAHVVGGPDHLAAVTPLAIESRKRSWSIGLAWGIGHTLGALAIGVLFLLFRRLVRVDIISAHSEQIVGVILIAVGCWAIVKIYRGDRHDHSHRHEDLQEGAVTHTHPHVHREQRRNLLASLGIGVVHGLAGISHLIGILPTLALPTRMQAVLYLTGFAFGTIIVMVAYSYVLGLLAQRMGEKNQHLWLRRLSFSGGTLAILVGIFWIVKSFGLLSV